MIGETNGVMIDASTTEEYSGDYPYGPQPAVVLVADRADTSEGFESWLPLQGKRLKTIGAIGLGLFFAAVNLIVCPFMAVLDGPANDWQVLPVFVLAGAILAECGLLSAWLVFSSGRFWFRAAGCWAVAMGLWLCWGAGLLLAAWIDSWQLEEEMLSVSLGVPIVALAVQSTLWCARCYFGWLVVHRTNEISNNSQLSIRDYFVGTAIVAISVTFVRLGRPTNVQPNDYWAVWSVAFLCFAAGGLLGVVPAMLLIFRVRDWRLGLAMFMLYGLVVSVGIVGIFDAASPTRPSVFDYVAMMVIFVSLATCLGAGIAVARLCGYSLIMGRDKSRAF